MKNFALTLGLSLAASSCLADTVIGVHGGYNSWDSEFSGATGVTDIDLNDNLGLDDERNNNFWLALEHPVPLLPNIMLAQGELSVSGDGTVNVGDILDDVTFSQDQAVATDLNLDYTDVTLYYELLDNWVTLDLGLTGRKLEGDLQLVGLFEQERVDVDDWVPLLYVQARADLPLGGWFVNANGYGISYSGNSYTDFSIALGYETELLFFADAGVEVGYRRMNFELEDLSDWQTDITVDGIYLGLRFHF